MKNEQKAEGVVKSYFRAMIALTEAMRETCHLLGIPDEPETPGLPPDSLADRQVLAGVLEGHTLPSDVRTGRPGSRYYLILQAAIAIQARGERVDRITVANELITQNRLTQVGGLAYLVQIGDHEIVDSFAMALGLSRKDALKRFSEIVSERMDTDQ